MSTLSELFLGDDAIPVGVRIDDVIHGLRIRGTDPAQALDNLEHVVEAAHASLDNVALRTSNSRRTGSLRTSAPSWTSATLHQVTLRTRVSSYPTWILFQ